MRIKRICVFVCVVLIGLLGASVVQARQNVITLTIAVFHPDFNDSLRQKLTAFESSHPGVQVRMVALPPIQTDVTDDPAKHLDEISNVAAAADVLQIPPDLISEAASRTGYFLDLTPLAESDATLNATDYYPAAWASWTWDGAQWGIPATIEPIVFGYDAVAFDRAKLAYPSESWAATELAAALRTLRKADQSQSAAIDFSDPDGLYQSLIGTPPLDMSTIPNPPQFDRPSIGHFLEVWGALAHDGLLNPSSSLSPAIQTAGLHQLLASDHKLTAMLYPGGRAGLINWGYALSGGTQFQAQAYQLARFLADAPETVQQGESFSARRTIGDAAIARLPAEVQTLAHRALDKAIPTADLRYAGYLSAALKQVAAGMDVPSAIRAAQSAANNALQLGMARRSGIALSVATPVPQPTVSPTKIVLKFGVTSGLITGTRGTVTKQELPNLATWEAIATEFARSDPEVGQVVIDVGTNPIGAGDDCFYGAFRNFSPASLKVLMSLDPLLEVDRTFDPSDFLSSVLAQVKVDNKTWMYPLNIQPAILIYEPAAFTAANVPPPTNGWTLDQFVDALKRLHGTSATPAYAIGASDLPLLMLIAAYGGLPIDFRTNPETIHFTDQAAVDAIRQVLDLVKTGAIQYFGQNDPALQTVVQSNAPIQGDVLTAGSFRFFAPNANTSHYRVTTFPSGTGYTALSYIIGSVLLNATTAHDAACYRWIKTLEKHPELFNAMPATHSQIHSQTLAALQGDDLIALYERVEKQLDDPKLVPFPSEISGQTFSQYVVAHWLYAAFDKYVLKGGDLLAALTDAESWAKGFEDCVASIPPFQPDGGQNTYMGSVRDCALKFDPTAAKLFPTR